MNIENIIKEAYWIGKTAQVSVSIQRKIIDACEPLLVFIVKQAHGFYEKQIKEFEIEKKKEEKRVRFYDFIREFSGRDDETFYLINFIFKSTESVSTTTGFLKDFELNQDSKVRYFKLTEARIRESNLYKLTEVIEKYIIVDFVEVSNISVKQGTKGFEITANLKDKQDRNWTFRTNAIPAGGYNIQQFHYRYLVDLSSPEVPRELVRKKITDFEKQEREKKIQEKNLQRQEKNKGLKAKLVTRIVMDIKGVLRGWIEWNKEELRKQVSTGFRPRNDADKIEDYIARLQDFIKTNIGNKKRNQIIEMALSQNLSIDFFDSIKDVFKSRMPFVGVDDYPFKQLEQMSQKRLAKVFVTIDELPNIVNDERYSDVLDGKIPITIKYGQNYKLGNIVDDEQLQKNMIVACAYKNFKKGFRIYRVLGITDIEKEFGEDGVKFNSVKELLRKYKSKNLRDLENKLERISKEKFGDDWFNHRSYLVLKNLRTNEINTLYYPTNGKWATGPQSEFVSFKSTQRV